MADPFFIVGNDRSGTTMLRLILDRGPDVAIPPESMFLTDLGDAFARRFGVKPTEDELQPQAEDQLHRLPKPAIRHHEAAR